MNFLVHYNLLIDRFLFDEMLMSQVRLPSMDGKVALVPWADMLNHSSEVSYSMICDFDFFDTFS